MTDATLAAAYEAVCQERDKLKAENTSLKASLGEAQARLRIIDLLEQESAQRFGVRVPALRVLHGHSLKVVEQ